MIKTRLTLDSAFFMENGDGKYTSSVFTPVVSSLRTPTSFSSLIISTFCSKIIK
jgi:hypothetical protein